MSPDRPVLLVLTHYGPPAGVFTRLIETGRVRPVRQIALREEDIAEATGIITTIHLDQNDFMRRRASLECFLDSGGRLAFNGHLVRPFIAGPGAYVPLEKRGRADLELVRLAPHPLFDGIPIASLITRRGVAGFYGRGHVPPPPGATAITGIGPECFPVDWEWERPTGGRVFCHAGNDLWTIADTEEISRTLAERLVDWCAARLDERCSA